MLKKTIPLLLVLFAFAANSFAQQGEMLQYHPIQTDKAGNIIPWWSPTYTTAYDHDIHLVWNFWNNMRRDPDGLPYYMEHQVFNKNIDDPRGIGGDQFMMAISSWRLLYAYTGDEHVKANIYSWRDII